MNTRERRQRKAERLRDWADRAETRANDHFRQSSMSEESTGIPFGQPILVGHHSEARHRKVIERAEAHGFKGVEESRKAERHEARADGIERQLDNTIFSDDDDAIERLEAKIAKLEAHREELKSFNKQRRKGTPIDEIEASDEIKKSFVDFVKYSPGGIGDKQGFPPYHMSNLGAKIRTAKKRLEGLRLVESGAKLRAWRTITAKFDGDCPQCGEVMEKGTQISKVAPRRWVHEGCAG